MVDLHWFGPKPAKQVVIFVHGFAVDWTSKGLFSDLAEHLAHQGLSSVLFDLSDYDQDDNATYLPLLDQQKRLRAVSEIVAQQQATAELNLVAHSLGCGLVASMNQQWATALNKVLLLAPGADRPGSRIKQQILNRPDALTKADKISFVRSNGSRNSFDQTYVQQLDIDFSDLYKKQWPKLKHLNIIVADSDQYPPAVKQLFDQYRAVTVTGSDHNFSHNSRPELLRLASSFLLTDWL